MSVTASGIFGATRLRNMALSMTPPLRRGNWNFVMVAASLA